ncbi:uncharacterized protein LOC131995343 [Stomoxys calcitrans]|uniref:uncharacterized protein LOC131995343 n=1 Tax=Stomoxys calcitrans TaxID=35570 RepID=UPI0027E3AD1F|nr:uncharacterized protein LOC131995343 [Stomoxys calcitrans]
MARRRQYVIRGRHIQHTDYIHNGPSHTAVAAIEASQDLQRQTISLKANKRFETLEKSDEPNTLHALQKHIFYQRPTLLCTVFRHMILQEFENEWQIFCLWDMLKPKSLTLKTHQKSCQLARLEIPTFN